MVSLEAVAKPGRAACPHAAAARPESAPYRIREVLQLPLKFTRGVPTTSKNDGGVVILRDKMTAASSFCYCDPS